MRTRRLCRSAAMLLVLGMAFTGLGSAALASQAPEEVEDQQLRVLPERLPATRVGSATSALWLWPAGRRGYQVQPTSGMRSGYVNRSEQPECREEIPEKAGPLVVSSAVRCPNTNSAAPDAYNLADLIAYDLDTNQEVARRRMSEANVWFEDVSAGQGHASLGAVDSESGRLFLPFNARSNPSRAAQSVKEQDYPGHMASTADGEEFCAPGLAFSDCLGGLVIIDGETLEPVTKISLRMLSADAAPMRPILKALDYAPPREPGDRGKVYMVIADAVQDPINHAATGRGANVLYLAQFDPEAGRQDWIVRMDACRYSRDSVDSNPSLTQTRPSPAAVVRSLDMEDRSVWVACHAAAAQGTMVRVPLDANDQPILLPVQAAPPAPDQATAAPSGAAPTGAVTTASGQEGFPGPVGAVEMMADPGSGRMLMRVIAGDPLAEVWWVFDTVQRTYIGTIGIGSLTHGTPSVAGLDRERGRLYVFVPPYQFRNVRGGMYVADIRSAPLPQALVYEHLAGLATWELVRGDQHNTIMPVDPGDETRLPRVYWHYNADEHWTVIEDAVPLAESGGLADFGGRTLDLEEAEGVTSAAWDGAARGYGARMLLVGGLEAIGRAGPADAAIYQGAGPRGSLFSSGELRVLKPYGDRIQDPCGTVDREIILASVGASSPAVVDVSGGRGSARPLSVDSTLAADMEAPVSRCAPMDWETIWETGLLGKPLVAEPTVPSETLFGKNEASCLSSAEESEDRTGGGLLTESRGDPVSSPFAASVACSPENVSGWSQARVTQIGELALSNAYASFRLYRDPARGVVARVESVARGVSMPAAFRVDSVRTVGESWANGRRQAVNEDAGYVANCDLDRTAGTCFARHVFGVWTPGYKCGPCGDESRLEAALTRAMGTNGTAKLREPDPHLARGADNGFIAAIQKPGHERFSDLVLNNDLLQTVVPGLEIVRYANPGTRMPGNTGGRGRQIYQFAGVEVSSSYGISCLLVYDEATNTCAEPAEAPGSIQVSLSDTDGKPLAGGAFELREDVDADGVLGLKDTLLPDGACVTAEDGIGTCTFEGLQPGTYLVSQVAAPPGYAKSAEPWVSEVASGEQRTVAFTNVSNVSTIDLKATDEHGAPISGATFAAYPDPDSDGKVAPDAKPAAECTTDAQGVCTMKVPAGSYVLVQTGAPGGLEGIEPVPFTFASGGQVASVTVVNYPPAAPEQPAPATAPIDYTPPVDYAPPVESVADFTPVAETPVIEEPTVSVPERIGGTVTQVIRAPGDALRLLARDPKQAVAWTAALALFCLAAMAVRRREIAAALSRLSDSERGLV